MFVEESVKPFFNRCTWCAQWGGYMKRTASENKRPSAIAEGLESLCGAYRNRTDDLLTASQTL